MGAGKTTVGRRLAERLGWAYLDSDAQVVATTGRTVPELFAEKGEAAFRAVESRVLAAALTGDEPVVVSAAGGVVLSEANRTLLARSGTVVWLRADPSLLARRVGKGEGRPLLDDDPAAVLSRLERERRAPLCIGGRGDDRRGRSHPRSKWWTVYSATESSSRRASAPTPPHEDGAGGARGAALRGDRGGRGPPPVGRDGGVGGPARRPGRRGHPDLASAWRSSRASPPRGSRSPTARRPSRWRWWRGCAGTSPGPGSAGPTWWWPSGEGS